MTPDSALRSIELDLSGYYLLGVESDPGDDGRDVTVTVSRPGVTVRPRRRLLIDDPAATAKDLAARALASPLVSSGVPIRDRRVRLWWTGARQSAARRSRGNRRGIFVTAIDGRRLPAARRGRQGRGQPRRRAGADAAHRRGSVGAPVRGDDRRQSRRVRVAHHCHRRQPRRQRGAEGRSATPWFGRPEDERPRRWRARVHDGAASTDRHFHGGVRQPARIRRSLRRLCGEHDGQVRGGASARQSGAAFRGWTRSSRRRRSRDFLARRVGPAASSRTIRFACNRHWQGVPGEPFGLAGVYAGHRFRDSGEPGFIKRRSSCPLPTSGSARCLRPQANRPLVATSAAGWSSA